MALGKVVEAVGVADTAYDEVSDPDDHKCVEDEVIHDCCIGDVSPAEPVKFWTQEVQSREDGTV